MRKCLILSLFVILLLPTIIALDFPTHKQSTDLAFSITSNNATGCNLTKINAPGSLITINQVGTQNQQTFNFSIAGGNYSEFGTYCHNLECSDGIQITSGEECYEINYFGKELTQQQSTIYVGLLGILIFTLFATFFGMNHLPASNTQDEQGKILSISYLKYFRLVLWLFAYFMFTAIMYLASNIAFAFLSEQLFAKILFAMFAMLLTISPVIIVVLMISFFVKFFHDKELQQYFNRGIFPGGEL